MFSVVSNSRTAPVRRLLARILGGEAPLGTGLLLLYALLMGTLGGAAEAGYISIRHVVRRELSIAYVPEVLWMAPLAGALAFLVVAVGLALLGRIARTGIDFSKATLIFAFFVVFGVVQSRGFPLHPAAKVVLCLGIATVIARAAAPQASALMRAIRRAAPVAAGVLVLLAVTGVLSLPGATERRRLARLAAPQPGAPNVLFIILDTVRSANLSLYGYGRDTSPRLDEWAASGVVFERATSTAPWTLPSHASMFTGEYNFDLGTAFRRPLDDRFPTLAEALGARGYATAAFVGNLSYATRASGLARGFAYYDDFPFTPGMFAHSYWILRGFARRIAALPGRQYWGEAKSAEQVTDDFLAWLQRRPEERPFFVFLNYFDAHDPYEPPPPFRTMYGPAPDHELSDDITYTTEQLRPWINAYDGAIRYVDTQLGRLLDELDAAGLRASTLVVVSSDHGEMFGEHGQIQHTSGVYIPALHVPLAFAMPGVLPAGVRVEEPVSLRDLPATILDVLDGSVMGEERAGAGIVDADRVAAESEVVGGVSLASLWSAGEAAPSPGGDAAPSRGGDAAPSPGGDAAPSPALAEMDFDHREILSDGHLKSLVAGTYHYILHPDGGEELYDVETDPREERNIAGDPRAAQTMARMRATVDSLFAHRGVRPRR